MRDVVSVWTLLLLVICYCGYCALGFWFWGGFKVVGGVFCVGVLVRVVGLLFRL